MKYFGKRSTSPLVFPLPRHQNCSTVLSANAALGSAMLGACCPTPSPRPARFEGENLRLRSLRSWVWPTWVLVSIPKPTRTAWAKSPRRWPESRTHSRKPAKWREERSDPEGLNPGRMDGRRESFLCRSRGQVLIRGWMLYRPCLWKLYDSLVMTVMMMIKYLIQKREAI